MERSMSRNRRSFSLSRSRAKPEVDGVVVRGRVIKSEDDPPPDEVDQELSSPIVDGAIEYDQPSVNDRAAKGHSSTDERKTGDASSDVPQAERPPSIDTSIARRITFASPSSPIRERRHARILSMQGVGARHNLENHPRKTPRPIYPHELPRIDERTEPNDRRTFLKDEAVGRNSQFAGLTLAEREQLGGAEYRALTFLAVLVPAYFILWQLLGCLGLGAYVAHNRVDATKVNAENPWYDQIREIARTELIDLQVGGCIQCGFCLQQQWHEPTGRKHGCISNVGLHANHNGPSDFGW